MRRPPNFVVWMILSRGKKGEDFLPTRYGGEYLCYGSRKLADEAMRGWARAVYGRGNSYVQQYGPIS